MTDTVQRFLFEQAPVRGEIVHLDATWRAVLERHNYPAAARELLRRLYSAEDLRVFQARPAEFRCTCSRERVAAMLCMLGRDEVESIVAEHGEVEVNCEFCKQRYRFDGSAAAAVFAGATGAPTPATRH